MATNQSYVSTTSVPKDIEGGFCRSILLGNITHQRAIKKFDVILLVPNFLFLVFLVYKIGKAQVQLHKIKCPIVKTVSFMVFLVCSVGIARCFVSMLLSSIHLHKGAKDELPTKILWLLLDCFQLAVELSVIIFGLWAGNMRDGRKGVRRVLCVTSICAVAYTSVQATLEFVHRPGRKNGIYGRGNDLFGHGGALFWSSTSFFLAMVYFLIVILPFTKLRELYIIPARRSFYVYCGILAVVDLVQGVGSLLLHEKIKGSLCILEGTMFVYYALFGPLVYWSFLKDFFASNRSFHELTVGDDYAGYVNSTLPSDDQINESSDEYPSEYYQK
ncbi:transmembrane protein adipocyte-associated 1 homolog isoform X1 [Acropora millepora]|uniref:transmembrane protein adipocyte-associated 1 homolog isoform X1 n=1 Tax=Acropora millepora TaxID=45264 RepID=UPI001CF22E91|nr:transmembrane protein adipocyte-associated 1 homolog isoform X1 [Acropora millepora]